MEQALYHPEHGYYSSGRAAIGRHGDYVTSVSVGALFGRMLATQFAEMWEVIGRPDLFTIVEQGAHHGDFAADILRAAVAQSPEFFAVMNYCIVEPFAVLMQEQTEKLTEFGGKVSWRKSLDELERFTGVHFSNELLDAMPVHLIRQNAGGWEETCVDETGGEFRFIERPLSNSRLEEHVRKLPALPHGYQTEVSFAAREWVDQVSRKLLRGYLLAADYGYSRDDFYASDRAAGTLRSYRRHRILPSPLMHVGEADITAHVEWTSVTESGLASGLDLAGFADQHHFLSALATGLCRNDFEANSDAGLRRQLQTLLHPTMLGRTFQFLALSKGIAPGRKLDGFRLAPEPRRSLALSAVRHPERSRGTP